MTFAIFVSSVPLDMALHPAIRPQVTAQVVCFREVAAPGPNRCEGLHGVPRVAHRQQFRKAYLELLTTAGLVVNTIPGKPTRRLQRHRLGDAGGAWLLGAHGARGSE